MSAVQKPIQKVQRRPTDILLTVSLKRDWADFDFARDSLPVDLSACADLDGELDAVVKTASRVASSLLADYLEERGTELQTAPAIDLEATEARQTRRAASDAIRDALAPFVLAQLRRVVAALLEVKPAKVTHQDIWSAWWDSGSNLAFPHVSKKELTHLLRQLWRSDKRDLKPMLKKHNKNLVGEKGDGGTFSRPDPDISWDERTKPHQWRVTSKVAKEWDPRAKPVAPPSGRKATDHLGRTLEADAPFPGTIARRTQGEALRELKEAMRELDEGRYEMNVLWFLQEEE